MSQICLIHNPGDALTLFPSVSLTPGAGADDSAGALTGASGGFLLQRMPATTTVSTPH